MEDFFFFFFCFFRAIPMAYGSSQTRGSNQSHSCWPTQQPSKRPILNPLSENQGSNLCPHGFCWGYCWATMGTSLWANFKMISGTSTLDSLVKCVHPLVRKIQIHSSYIKFQLLSNFYVSLVMTLSYHCWILSDYREMNWFDLNPRERLEEDKRKSIRRNW